MAADGGPRGTWDFERFFADTEPPLRRALVARYGPDRGREATAEALAFAWERQPLMQELRNPVAYLFTVGRSRTRRNGVAALAARSDRSWEACESAFEPGLGKALAALTPRQRTAVVLVVGYRWSYAEVAELLHLRRASVQRHVERAIAHLRDALGVLEPIGDLTHDEGPTP